jgi:hypothetical protein
MIQMKRIFDKINSPSRTSKHFYVERRSRKGFAICLAMVCLAGWGCSSNQPPVVNIVQIESIDRPPKQPDCSLTILHSDLLASNYQKVAIVEAWGKPGQEEAVLEAVRRGACETGADALLIVSSQSQVDGRSSTDDPPETSGAAQENGSGALRDYKGSLAPRIGELGHAGYYVDGIALIQKSL